VSFVLINEYSTELFFSYSPKNPIAQKFVEFQKGSFKNCFGEIYLKYFEQIF